MLTEMKIQVNGVMQNRHSQTGTGGQVLSVEWVRSCDLFTTTTIIIIITIIIEHYTNGRTWMKKDRCPACDPNDCSKNVTEKNLPSNDWNKQ